MSEEHRRTVFFISSNLKARISIGRREKERMKTATRIEFSKSASKLCIVASKYVCVCVWRLLSIFFSLSLSMFRPVYLPLTCSIYVNWLDLANMRWTWMIFTTWIWKKKQETSCWWLSRTQSRFTLLVRHSQKWAIQKIYIVWRSAVAVVAVAAVVAEFCVRMCSFFVIFFFPFIRTPLWVLCVLEDLGTNFHKLLGIHKTNVLIKPIFFFYIFQYLFIQWKFSKCKCLNLLTLENRFVSLNRLKIAIRVYKHDW